MNLIHRVINKVQKTLFKTEFDRTYDQWVKDHGDQSLRLNYPLTAQSLVLDLGGYEGEWSQQIFNKYGSQVLVFEPVQKFSQNIEWRFKGNAKIKVFNFGLGATNTEMQISLAENSSSVFGSGGPRESIQIRSVSEFWQDQRIQIVDLMKINIEGGEYDLLNSMIENQLHKMVMNLQIQFHNFFPEATERREQIRRQLAETHRCTYNYPFIWENWERR